MEWPWSELSSTDTVRGMKRQRRETKSSPNPIVTLKPWKRPHVRPQQPSVGRNELIKLASVPDLRSANVVAPSIIGCVSRRPLPPDATPLHPPHRPTISPPPPITANIGTGMLMVPCDSQERCKRLAPPKIITKSHVLWEQQQRTATGVILNIHL